MPSIALFSFGSWRCERASSPTQFVVFRIVVRGLPCCPKLKPATPMTYSVVASLNLPSVIAPLPTVPAGKLCGAAITCATRRRVVKWQSREERNARTTGRRLQQCRRHCLTCAASGSRPAQPGCRSLNSDLANPAALLDNSGSGPVVPSIQSIQQHNHLLFACFAVAAPAATTFCPHTT